jgi:hypothetical protein
MRTHAPFHDAVFGRVTWNAQDHCWEFDAGPIDGCPVPARYIPAESHLPPADQGWDGVRDCVRWVRTHEPTVRAFIVQKIHNPTPLSWWLSLTGINFYNDQQARLIYGAFGLVVSVHVNAVGQIVGSNVLVSG